MSPDIADKGRDFYRCRYRSTSFELPQGYQDRDLWLQTEGIINYISKIWLNGRKVGGMVELVK